MKILECKKLSKAYDSKTMVLDGLDFELEGGKIYGLLGPNGCGKSTLIKMIAGLLKPSQGEVLVCGQPISEKTKALVSYLPERTYFSNWMKVGELIQFFTEFYEDFRPDVARQMLKELGISEKSQLKTLSKGTKEKVQLIMVMARDAKLYLLDEPIGGVDPASREYILNTIIGNYSPDSAVLITTHLIHDVEPALDEFAFMGFGGKILKSGNADDARAESGKTLDELFREVFRCAIY
ncbi:MAG: ABC transporter ATP-binding protein [Clostridia bacterium]|nr:ABC transporter ATP-binding protein [Clostridia bacterium]